MANELTVTSPEFRSVYNDTAGTVAKGTMVKLTTTPYHAVVVSAHVNDPHYGVLAEDIEAYCWGKCQVKGVALVLCHAAVTVGGRVGYAAAPGEAGNAGAGNAVLGIALTAGGTTELAEVELSGPGGARMPG